MLPKKITDYDVLKKHYTFLNDENDKSWESNLVSNYHETLFKEFAVCDLSKYKSGDIALRWRSANEVVEGKCESICANVSCTETLNLSSYEVLFNYIEHKVKKQALVKVRVCPECSYKLNYKLKFKKTEPTKEESD
ncbi:Folate-sensitive fragile site protein Fra10Ac1 family protein [Theileria parva strain Muguga]|uniref:Folate-sensitive fragile site protein Fra10Ac1 family protein n=1 Tax=Theileria parva strain Muguga TaxID=333668 RepID=UPI001C619211|nr:Folate-sensitive fragile site protein Fra10Ac1 family protein [Theileria parva strain Muguga]KAF5153621.1 Folate-sensitive fragile site protein Fra10Ac1 family protein [Theileria parva strain Muguga]